LKRFVKIVILFITFKKKGLSKMNKTDLVNKVSFETGLSKKDVDTIVSATLNAISQALAEGDKVQLIGFGNFEVKESAQREGRNPKTGEAITIAASKKPVFSASKVLKDSVNK
jgi:DNA-binding protein HU-beta